MKKSVFLLVCFIAVLLCGCAKPAVTTEENGVVRYDLGEGSLTTSDNGNIPYQIQGTLGIPSGKAAPIVVLIHGSHPIELAKRDRYDIGFDYLTKSLSEQGNLVISMNVGMNYSFEAGEPAGNERSLQIISQQLTLLQKAIQGDKSIFGRDLSGVGDFNKLVLMGHSRGGMDVFEWAAKAPADMKVLGIAAVAPSNYKTMDTPMPNVPIGIVIPQMDGDVIQLDGNDFYEYLMAQQDYNKAAELVYLKNANHGYFNTELKARDLNHNEADAAKLMAPDTQRKFFEAYMLDFVKSVTSSGETVFSASKELPGRAYGCDVLLRVRAGSGEQLFSARGKTEPSTGENTSAKQVIYSYLQQNNTAGTFNMPGSAALARYELEQIVWTGEVGSVKIPLSADLSEARFVDVDMAVDSTDSRTKDGTALTVKIRDKSGKEASLQLDSASPALLWQEGELVKDTPEDGGHYSSFTPLVTMRIPVQSSWGLDLKNIDSLSFSFRSAEGGSVMLRSIAAVK